MADIPSDIEKIQIEETEFEAPVSEAVAQKIGASINGLIDYIATNTTFTSNGTFTVPNNTTVLGFLGCGGGGGGGGGNWGNFPMGLGGAGGSGVQPTYVKRTVSPGETLTIVIGAGGAGGAGANTNASAGSEGGLTYVTGSVSGLLCQFYGGKGGGGAINSPTQTPGAPSSIVATSGTLQISGGYGGAPSVAGLSGGSGCYAGGGAGGPSGGANGGGGGGGGGGYATGGAGGAGANSGNGQNGFVGGIGAGGGGGGAGRATGTVGGTGGAGGPGFLRIVV